jgi:hypothetical protein
MANSRSGLEAWLAGVEAANGITMMFGVHGTEKVGGGFVARFLLASAPVHEQTVAESPKYSHHPYGLGFSHTALIIQMRYIQALMQTVFDAPGGPIVPQPLRGVEFLRQEARH